MSMLTSATASAPPVGGPVAEADRIVALDALRGFAVLGILVMNVQVFSMIGTAYMNPSSYGDLEGANRWVWYLSHLLADQKFMTIFSMLFGAGVVLMTSRREATGRGSAAVHYRRMAWLVLFGLLHAHLLWYGDILYSYGLCGLVLWLFRRLPPWLLLGLGFVAIALGQAMTLLSGLTMPAWGEEAIAAFETQNWRPPPDAVAAEVAAYRGSWLDQMAYRVPGALFFQTFLFVFMIGWRAGGVMLVGMGLHKLGVFTGARRTRFYAGLVAAGALVGLPIVAYGAHRNLEAEWDVAYSFFFGALYNYWGSLLVALGWVGAVMLACRTRALAPVVRALVPVGRMALTNYLLQTVICTTIFYGHGFGLFGRVERTGQLGIVALVWIVQLVLSPIWLRFFRFGPAEWLWRTLTYWRLQPMRRVARSGDPAPRRTGP